MYRLNESDLQQLVQELQSSGYRVIGPKLNRTKTAIEYKEIEAASDFPEGFTDIQKPGEYRILESESKRRFHYNALPNSTRTFLNPNLQTLWKAKKDPDTGEIAIEDHSQVTPEKQALFGLRACDLASTKISESVFSNSQVQDPQFAKRRNETLQIAVECSKASDTCFCTSMNTGPAVLDGFDLRLTELEKDGEVFYLAEPGSESLESILTSMNAKQASEHEPQMRDAQNQETIRQVELNPKLEIGNLPSKMKAAFESPHWDEVASRCIGCSNCTLSCPTCFCSKVDDVADLTATETEKVKSWASCFENDFSYIHGGEIRASLSSKYRQWLTHKFSTWTDQFQTMGCVGCGRCTTWCPVGIDVRQEVIKATESAPSIEETT